MPFSRTAAFIAGVVATLVVGAGTAVAGGGASVLLGQGNPGKAVTGLANSKGTPLSLQAKKGSAPLKVNSSVKVKGLNTDLLDGNDASAFLPVGGTAVNAAHSETAAHADTATHADAASNAGHASNADKLGGQDPSAYLTNVYAAGTNGASLKVTGSDFDTLTIPPGTYQVLFTADLGNRDSVAATFFCQPRYVPPVAGVAPYGDVAVPAGIRYGSLAISQVVTFAAVSTVSINCYSGDGNPSGNAVVLNSGLSLTQVHLVGGTATPALKSSAVVRR